MSRIPDLIGRKTTSGRSIPLRSAPFGLQLSARVPAGLIWVLPVAIVALVFVSPFVSSERIVAALAALALVVLAAKRPDRALLALIVLLPFQALILAKLYMWGVPASVVRPLAGWKEALVIGVVIAGAIGFRHARRHLDSLDWLGLAFVAIAAVYALAPGLAGPLAPTDLEVRSLGFRQATVFVVLLLAARHARLPAGFLAQAMKVTLATGVLVAAVALYEWFTDPAWNDFVVQDLGYVTHQIQVLDTFPHNLYDLRSFSNFGGEDVLRVGSVLLSPLTLGLYLLVPFAIGVERVVRTGARLPLVAALFAIGAALLLTQTRSAIIAAFVIVALAFRFAPGRRQGHRVQVGALLALGLLVAVPVAFSTGFAERAQTTESTSDPTDPAGQNHLDALRDGIEELVNHPLGQGLGTSAGIGQRFAGGPAVTSENNYLGVGNEIGVVAMVLFILLTLAVIRELRRATLRSGLLGVSALWSAAIGLAIGAFFLHAWVDFAVAWTFWGLAGAALSVTRPEDVAQPPMSGHERQAADEGGGRALPRQREPEPAELMPG